MQKLDRVRRSKANYQAIEAARRSQRFQIKRAQDGKASMSVRALTAATTRLGTRNPLNLHVPEVVAKGNADGYTLMLGNVSTLAIARALYPKLAYDPLRDFAPVTLITTSENVVVVHPSLPVDSIKALIAYARFRPGQINYGSAASGTTTHLGGLKRPS